ncbi:Tm-1-like ATP-binding domain-containing protein [Haloplanus pelagicus]|uniref:Tm-1-like ATP-binding domain-containing protein n=1 Tax=Haloplanus pelagicus TaxID=2949995 RepID=UPI003CE547F3
MSIVIVGTLDTKGEEIAFARDVVADARGEPHDADTGVLGEAAFDPDTSGRDGGDDGPHDGRGGQRHRRRHRRKAHRGDGADGARTPA